MSWGWTPIWNIFRHSAWESIPISRSATPPGPCRKTRRGRTGLPGPLSANQAYTPLQLANYIATLVSGGEFCQPHLLKAVKTYDNTEVVTVGETKPERVVSISDSTLDAVKRGMLGYTQPGGSVYNAFRNCVVTAGAKTGTSQLGGDQTENGVFVCFAPYDDPEIAVAIVIEHATWGANVASTGVEILNAYFSADTNTSSVTGENQLLP